MTQKICLAQFVSIRQMQLEQNKQCSSVSSISDIDKPGEDLIFTANFSALQYRSNSNMPNLLISQTYQAIW